MSETQETNDTNPLTLIFKTIDKGEISGELNSVKNIQLFFNIYQMKIYHKKKKYKL